MLDELLNWIAVLVPWQVWLGLLAVVLSFAAILWAAS